MYITKDKIIYEPLEHLSMFPRNIDSVYGYEFLKTKGERSSYAINKVPIYILRDKEIEYAQNYKRLYKEYLWDEKENLKRTKLKFMYHSLLAIYEQVKIFPAFYHHLEVPFDEILEVKDLVAPEGYLFYRLKPIRSRIIETIIDPYQKKWLTFVIEKYFKIFNSEPVICEKAVGEMESKTLGMPLEMEDKILLNLIQKGMKL